MVDPAATTSAIVLCTLNAKYIHASLGLRYLLANMDRHGGAGLRARTVLREYTIARDPQQIVDELLALNPAIVGFGVYIWNVTQTTEVVRRLKAARPGLKVVLGGPEVSHEVQEQEIVQLADHVITGWGDVSFPRLCQALLHGPQPLMKVIAGEQPPLDQIALPYAEYSDDDLAHRLLYVEASRGCPFKCEFCLSSLDKTAWAFDLDAFLAEMDALHRRGARHFKFVDRTFNLKVEASVRILQFFLDRMSDLFVHFEVIPDHLPERLKAMIARFPAGVLQFEVGIQSFNEEVQQRISRRQDNAKTEANLRWLVHESPAHLHADLIFGLPGETLQSFAAGFDRLHALGPHEIQLGLLKRLRGTPIARHTATHGMVYDPEPPYTVRQTSAVDAATVQRYARLARYWELVANSGRFTRTLVLLLQGPSAFAAFLAFSDWLWQQRGETAHLTPEQLVDALHDYLTGARQLAPDTVQAALVADYVGSGARARPASLREVLPPQGAPVPRAARQRAERQARHADQVTDEALDSAMLPPSRYWSDLSTRDFAQLDLARVIAVLPVAATEQHGPHLPLSVDTDLADGVVAASLPHLPAGLPVLFLPTQAVGYSPEHQAYAGTLTLSSHTLIHLWTDIGESVARAGVKKLVLLNAHGGQVGLLDVVARDLRARLGLLVYSVNWFNLPLGAEVEGQFSAEEHRYGIHAGQIETAMMLALKPERVAMAQAQHFASASQQRAQQFPVLGNGKSAKLAWQMQDYNPAGAVGNAAAATAAQGRTVLDAAGRALAALLAEIDRLPPDTLAPAPAAGGR